MVEKKSEKTDMNNIFFTSNAKIKEKNCKFARFNVKIINFKIKNYAK